MTQDDVLTLARAGFTSEQIMKMAQLPAQPQPQIQAQVPQQIPSQQFVQPQAQQMPQMMVMPYPQPMIQAQVQPQQMIQQQPTVQPQGTTPEKNPFDQLFEQMTGIKQAIQNNNLQNSVIQTQPQTTDDILASIIQPTNPQKEENK